MTAVQPGFAPLADGDPGWLTFEGDVRVRTVGGTTQLQVSVDNGDGTFDVATLVLAGGLRDVRRGSTTRWPSFNADGLPTNFVTDSDRLAREVARANAKGEVSTSGAVLPPVSGSNTGQ